jgi:arginine decarboxylase
MSTCSVNQGERGTAGIIYGRLYHRETNEKYGGLVCENDGDYSVEELQYLLQSSLNELYINGFQEEYRLEEITYLHETIIPQKKYGTAIVALCFTSYYYPSIGQKISFA